MRRILSLAALIAVPSCGGDDGPAPGPILADVMLERQWTGVSFHQPIYLTQAPGDDAQWYVVEREGKVRALPAGATDDTQARDFASVTVNAAGEGGLLGMAFHPDWPTRREVYLSYTRDARTGDPAPLCPGVADAVFTSVVARYQSSDGTALDSGPDEFFELGQPYENHDGGNLQFGRDGMLYLGLGDGGSANDPCGSGQNLGSLLGKILRIDVNEAGPYKIPADNPLADNPAARKEIWAWGLRNPWRWSFDTATGELWVGDVGQGTWEEVDRVVKGGNYGWNTCEGFHERGDTTDLCKTPGLLSPVVEHPRSEAASITGGYVYRGSAIPSLGGAYIYGDFITGNVWALTSSADRPVPSLIFTVARGTLVSFGQGNDGELYTVQISGEISKLVPRAP